MTKKNNQPLFAVQEVTSSNGGANQLSKTAQLTSVSANIANEILNKILGDAEYAEQIKQSQTSHDVMDNIVETEYDLQSVDIDFLKVEDEETLDKMLKSQQSKRSRSKSKAMTQENYTSMMTAAIAEHLLREASGKPKGNGGYSGSSDPTYTAEELEAFSNNPSSLTKAIRNVQSKKSIAKSKADFDEKSDRWLLLLQAEQQLKDVRSQMSGMVDTKTKEAVEAKEAVENLLADQDLSNMSSDDALALLIKTKEMLAGR